LGKGDEQVAKGLKVSGMNIVREEMNLKFAEGFAEGVATLIARIREELMDATNEDGFERLFKILIKFGNLSEKEIEEICELKNLDVVQRKMYKQFAEGVATVRSEIRQKLIIALRHNKPGEWIRELIELSKFTDQEVRGIYTEARKAFDLC